MNANRNFELNQFQKISQKMLTLAEANDWERIHELETERKKLIQSFFEKQQTSIQNLSHEDCHKVEQTIKNVLSINHKLSQLAEQKKVSISLKYKILNKNTDYRVH